MNKGAYKSRLDLRVAKEELEAWKTAASSQGKSLNAWVRDACVKVAELEAQGGTVIGPPIEYPDAVVHNKTSFAAVAKKPRRGLCVHRRTADQFCSRCDG